MPPPAPGCASCAARDEEIALLRDQVDVLRAQQRELHDKIARLERVLSRNSGNSSMPPSGDDQPGKKQPRDRKAGTAASGGPASSRARREHTWPGTTIPITRSRISRRAGATAARTLPGPRTWA